MEWLWVKNTLGMGELLPKNIRFHNPFPNLQVANAKNTGRSPGTIRECIFLRFRFAVSRLEEIITKQSSIPRD